MMEALVSVIIPVYNAEVFLDACIQSVVDQSYSNLEIILVDDGSSDRCPQICDAWAQRDRRIRVIHQSNSGAAAARNAGLDIAKGEYIGFVDSDDLIDPDMYEIMVSALVGESIGVVNCCTQLITEDGVLIKKTTPPPMQRMNTEQALDTIFTMQASISMCSRLCRHDVLQGIRFPVGETNEEAPITIPVIVNAKGMLSLKDALYYYRQREGSVTSPTVPSEKNSDIVYRNFQRMRNQLREYKLTEVRQFPFYEAAYSFWRGLNYEKKYSLLTPKVKQDYKVYRKVMWRNAWRYLCSSHCSIKSKVLYTLVLTKLLRPVYKVFRLEKP